MTTGVVVESQEERSKRLRKERHARYVKTHPERRAATHKRYRERNPEKIKALNKGFRERNPNYGREWYAANRESVRARHAEWKKSHPETVRLLSLKRREKVRMKDVDVSAAWIRQLLRLQKGMCAYCRTQLKPGYHVDHIMPVSKGGKTERSNLQLLCPPCNLRKAAKHPVRFMQEIGMLL